MKRTVLALLPLLVTGVHAADDKASQESNDFYGRPLDDLLRVETQLKADVGSRGGSRDALDAEVPIDVITSAQLQASGHTELTRVLSMLIPGFNSPRPSIADGTDHAPPFTLRGLNPDQVLVLINGKRQHQSSLLHINGTIGRGSSSVDLNTIPLRAIERIEVLRDGAAAQYGSDAIAGIINIILKGYGQENQLNLSYGGTTEGDGISKQADLFYSRPLSGDGFINLTGELRDRGSSNRAGPDPRDDGQVNTHFGDADTQDALLAINAELPRGDTVWYFHGLYDRRDSRAGAFFRRADDDRNIPSIYPDGFLPSIEPEIRDFSATAGVKGILDNGTHWNLSYSHGHNDYHFYVDHSLNRSLGEATPTAFDSGATSYTQQIVNLDLNRKFGRHHLAGGYEFRQEHYRIRQGEEASYILGPYAEWYPGAQGFGGFMPENEVSARRRNHAAYIDHKLGVNQWLMLDTAARAEHYSDFGSTLDGKLAIRARPTEDLLLRASTSTGFRAPSLSQANFTSTAMIRDGESIIQYGTYGVDHPVAQALGATELKPEKSRHFTAGVVFQPSSQLTASADYFLTDIDDRIMATGYIASWNLESLSQEAVDILKQHGVDGAVYFTNAIGTRTKGFDLRLDYSRELANASKLKLSGAYQQSETRITHVNPAPSVLGVDMTDLILDSFTRVTTENGQPSEAFKLWTRYESANYDLILNLNRFGEFSSTKSGEKMTFGAKWTVDMEFAYRISKNTTLALGGENIFDTKPQEWGETDDSLMGSGKVIRYSQYAPFGYNGAYYYLRLGTRF